MDYAVDQTRYPRFRSKVRSLLILLDVVCSLVMLRNRYNDLPRSYLADWMQ